MRGRGMQGIEGVWWLATVTSKGNGRKVERRKKSACTCSKSNILSENDMGTNHLDCPLLTLRPQTCVMTHNSHGWCEGGATALNVVTVGDLGVWRRVSQAPGSAVAQLPVNYLAQQVGSPSARRDEEEDKACSLFRRVCVSSGWLGLQWNICHIPLGVWGSSDASVRGKQPRRHNSCSYLAPACRGSCMFGDSDSLPDTLVKKWRSVDGFHEAELDLCNPHPQCIIILPLIYNLSHQKYTFCPFTGDILHSISTVQNWGAGANRKTQ